MHNLVSRDTPSPPSAAEATVPDIQLAEALGYERATDFRKLIKRHAVMLEAMGSLRHRVAMIETGKGARRATTEYHLNRAQAVYLIAKSGTKRADSLTAQMAEVYAMFSGGGLVAVDANAEADLASIAERERQRRLLIHAEEKAARNSAFIAMKRR